MVKQHIKKQSNNLGHNNPPEVLRIEFTNSAIEKLKIDDLDFGSKRYLSIPFIVPKGSHLKGLYLRVSITTKSKEFFLRYWLKGLNHKHSLGTYKPYRNPNDLGFTCIQVNKKQYDLWNEHTNDKGLYTTSPKVVDKIKETDIKINSSKHSKFL